MRVEEIMTRKVNIVEPDVTVRDAARFMREEDVGDLPVGENGRLIGIVTDRDIVIRAVADARDPGKTAVRDVMSEGVHFVYADASAEEAGRIMAQHQVRRLPVLDREKHLVGIVGIGDLGVEAPAAGREALQGVVAEEHVETHRVAERH